MVTHKKRRRLSFFGHIARLPDDAPAKLALNEFRNTKATKFRKGQKLTWLKQTEKEIRLLDFDLEQAIEQTQNREQWQGQIERIMRVNEKSTPSVKHVERHQSKELNLIFRISDQETEVLFNSFSCNSSRNLQPTDLFLKL